MDLRGCLARQCVGMLAEDTRRVRDGGLGFVGSASCLRVCDVRGCGKYCL